MEKQLLNHEYFFKQFLNSKDMFEWTDTFIKYQDFLKDRFVYSVINFTDGVRYCDFGKIVNAMKAFY